MQEYEENFDSYATKSQSDIIKFSLKETYNNLSEKELREFTREAVFAPNDRIITISSRQISASDLRYELANQIEQLSALKTPNNESSQIAQANSIEVLNSGTNSIEEYFSWLNITVNILKNMNDGFVSDDDLTIRNKFLTDTDQRETELMLCLGLLDNCRHPKAHEFALNLRYKLQKLREMRSAIQLSTRNKSDVEINRTEYERAIPYYKAFKTLQKLPFGYDINKKQKIDLGIDHDDDDDLEENFSYYDLLLENTLNEMRQEDEMYIASHEYQLAYDIAQERNLLLSDEISEKMKKLTGRKNSFRLKYESLDSSYNKI
ncbi:MAG: hypothetical protein IJ019_04560 [Alphaproteobacteria bacterium]|nr:hypothetical protein [Alphaproteobacteria bacterium]